MQTAEIRSTRRVRRARGLRKKIFGTPGQPRLAVFRSQKHIYAQVIDDLQGATIASASTRDKDFSGDKSGNTAAASAVGELLARRAMEKGVTAVAFDRRGFRYHGRVKALADAARKAGLKF